MCASSAAPDGRDVVLTRTEASRAAEGIGWRYLLGNLATSIPVISLEEAAAAAAAAVLGCGADADRHLRADLRPDRVELSLQDHLAHAVTARDAWLAHRVTEAVRALGLPRPDRTQVAGRPVQMLEVAIDALDISAIRPFWKAVTAYVDEPDSGHEGALLDPAGQLPAIWFQQMDAPRPQRNRIHLDITVPHDVAEERVRTALEAGGRMVNAAWARSFWVLADAEGNEACVCTWLDRDAREAASVPTDDPAPQES